MRFFVFHCRYFTLAGPYIERVIPLGNGEGADAVTDQVSHGPRFVEEAVNAQQQDEPYQRDGVDGGECGSQRHKSRTRYACRAFGRQQEYTEQNHLIHKRQRRIGCLGNKDGGHCEVDTGSVRIEGVSRWQHHAHD